MFKRFANYLRWYNSTYEEDMAEMFFFTSIAVSCLFFVGFLMLFIPNNFVAALGLILILPSLVFVAWCLVIVMRKYKQTLHNFIDRHSEYDDLQRP